MNHSGVLSPAEAREEDCQIAFAYWRRLRSGTRTEGKDLTRSVRFGEGAVPNASKLWWASVKTCPANEAIALPCLRQAKKVFSLHSLHRRPSIASAPAACVLHPYCSFLSRYLLGLLPFKITRGLRANKTLQEITRQIPRHTHSKHSLQNNLILEIDRLCTHSFLALIIAFAISA